MLAGCCRIRCRSISYRMTSGRSFARAECIGHGHGAADRVAKSHREVSVRRSMCGRLLNVLLLHCRCLCAGLMDSLRTGDRSAGLLVVELLRLARILVLIEFGVTLETGHVRLRLVMVVVRFIGVWIQRLCRRWADSDFTFAEDEGFLA